MALAILSITLLQGFKSPSNMNSSNLLDLNGHIEAKLMSKSEKITCMNYSALEPVLFEILHNIKLSQSVFRVYPFFQFISPKAVLDIFSKILKTLYSKLVTYNDCDNKSYDVKQHILTYWALLKLCSDNHADCKLQIMQLTSQINKSFATLDHTGPIFPVVRYKRHLTL